MSSSPVALTTNESGQNFSFPMVAVIKTCLRVLPLKENNLRMKMRMGPIVFPRTYKGNAKFDVILFIYFCTSVSPKTLFLLISFPPLYFRK